jgi:alanyl-tRNA synthetase
VRRLVRFGPGGGAEAVETLAAGEEGVAVLDRTVFYAESGGQVGDRGRLVWEGGVARVGDTQKDAAGTVFHFVAVEVGALAAGAAVRLVVDPAHRLPTQRNHTATHLLHAALREVLGGGARQAGSLVAPDRLRFDFTHPRPLTPEEVAEIEARVNAQVLLAAPTEIVEGRSLDEALAAGAMALFGEKYGERVRTVAVPGVSLELCGGCHVASTGEIGPFVLTSERGIASGVRRIEALTGEAALAHLKRRSDLLAAVEERLGVGAERAADEVDALRRQLRERDHELARLRLQAVAGGGPGGGEERLVEGVKVLAREVPPAPAGELRSIADTLRGRLGSGVVVIGARHDGKVTLIATVTPDLAGRVGAGGLVRRLAPIVGGGGGGRPDFAQAGGKDPDRLPDLLAAVPEAVRAELG